MLLRKENHDRPAPTRDAVICLFWREKIIYLFRHVQLLGLIIAVGTSWQWPPQSRRTPLGIGLMPSSSSLSAGFTAPSARLYDRLGWLALANADLPTFWRSSPRRTAPPTTTPSLVVSNLPLLLGIAVVAIGQVYDPRSTSPGAAVARRRRLHQALVDIGLNVSLVATSSWSTAVTRRRVAPSAGQPNRIHRRSGMVVDSHKRPRSRLIIGAGVQCWWS